MSYDEETRAAAAQLAVRCREEGMLITADGCVYPNDAAALLDRSPRTLENWRLAGDERVKWRRGRVGRLRYALLDIAAALLKDGDAKTDPQHPA